MLFFLHVLVLLREFLIAYIKTIVPVVIFTVLHFQGEAEITVLLLLRASENWLLFGPSLIGK